MPRVNTSHALWKRSVSQAIRVCVLFIGAGTLNWTRGWIYSIALVGAMQAVGLVLSYLNPEVLQARAVWRRPGTKAFDKFILAILVPATLLQPAIAGADVVRFHWSSMPFWLVYPGVALLGVGSWFMGWSLAANPNAEPTVRIQADRGQRTVMSGPYRFLRHPMYAGSCLFYAAPPLILGSQWALIVSGLITMLLLLRTAAEDRVLQRELPGYDLYARQTKYRLIPGLW